MKLLPWLLGGAAAVLTGGAALGALGGLGAAGAAGAGAAGAGAAGTAAAGGLGSAAAGGLGAAGTTALAAPTAASALGAGAGGLGSAAAGGLGAAGTAGAAGTSALAAPTAAAAGSAGAGGLGGAGALGANFFPAAPGALGAGGAGAANTTLGAVIGAPGATAAAAPAGGVLGGVKSAIGGLGKLATPGNLMVGGMVANQLGLFNGGGGSSEEDEGEGPELNRDHSARPVDFNHDPLKDTSEHTYFTGKGYADGGPVMDDDQPDQAAMAEIEKGAVAALQGQHPQPQEAIELFLEFFGPDALEDLMADVNADKAANSQIMSEMGGKQGGLGALKGPGDGMSDSIPAVVDGKTPARLATDEHVIPADVVAGLGNGSSDAGHKALRSMTEGVRTAKGGSPKQPAAIDPSMFMPG